MLVIGVLSPVLQIENIEVGKHTTINKLYTGLYARTQIPVDTLVWSNQVSYRLGVLATHRLSDIFSVSTQGAFQIATGSNFTSIADFELVAKFTDRWQVRVGSLTTPVTFIRPNPITWQSQTETYAQSRILVQRPGAITSYQLNDLLAVTYGIHYQNSVWAHHTRIGYKGFKVGGYLQVDGEYFAVVDYKGSRLEAIANYSSIENEFSSSIFYNINNRYTLYTDANFYQDSDTTTTARLGGRSYYRSDAWRIQGFVAFEYDVASELISAELFIHLR